MILTTRIYNQPHPGLHKAKLIAMEYAKKPTGEYRVLKTGEKGLEATFKIAEYNTTMKFIFWLTDSNDRLIKTFARACGGVTIHNTVHVKELVGRDVWIIIYEERYYRNGKPIVDINKKPIRYLKVANTFLPFHPQQPRPKIDIEKYHVTKYMDGLSNIANEVNEQKASI